MLRDTGTSFVVHRPESKVGPSELANFGVGLFAPRACEPQQLGRLPRHIVSDELLEVSIKLGRCKGAGMCDIASRLVREDSSQFKV